MQAYELKQPTGLDGLVLVAGRDRPEPGLGQVVVRVRACSLNSRDLGVVRGAYGYTRFPMIPLSDGAGEVVAIGDGVQNVRVGERVAGTFFQTWASGRIPPDASRNSLGGMLDGMLAEFVALPERGVIAIPEHLSFEEAATLPCAALTAWHALVEAGRLKAGEVVLILGTGGVSCFGIQLARMHSARVIVISSSEAKLERARHLGADGVIDYGRMPDWDKEVLRLTDGIGVDHVIEIGGAQTLEKSINATRPGGSIYVIGASAGEGKINPRPINRKSITLKGIHVGSREMFAAMNRAVASARLKPVIDRAFAFADAKRAYEHMATRAHFGKIVIAGA
ncbi:MAG TPA: NAD(P)-dependent alcohol dehydrogenase [Hyphomicrobiaceae bacterium]|jgi:NADPH:quinone reductase-like Zn-dependent oxidoreductase|nr:NAD(P)-dependent alcohol dehydrogenase [Hyphomicrobiaceae bacterium]